MELTHRQRDILTGSLLGDGSLTKIYSGRNSAFRELHGDSQFDYLSWKEKELQPYTLGISLEMHKEIVGRNAGSPVFGPNKTRKSWCLRTKNHQCFSTLEQQWYSRDDKGNYILDRNKRRIKIVPETIRLSPLAAAVWFFDDGTNCFNGKLRIRSVVLYTMGFSLAECERLVLELQRLGVIDCGLRRRKNGQYEIVVWTGSFDYFIGMVSEFMPCTSMQHKVFIEPRNQPKHKVNEELVAYIRRMKMSEGRTGKEIAGLTNVSEATVSMILSGKHKKANNAIVG